MTRTSHLPPMVMNDKGRPPTSIASTRKGLHSKPKNQKMTHSMVKDVSKLSVCTSSTASTSEVSDDCHYFYEVCNDDGSHTTETATSSTVSSLSLQSPSLVCQGPSVRLASSLVVMPHCNSMSSSCANAGPRQHRTSQISTFAIAHDMQYSDRRPSTDKRCYNQKTNNKPPLKCPETVERPSHRERPQNRKKIVSNQENDIQQELKRQWELLQQQQQQQRQQLEKFLPPTKTLADEERGQSVARRSQGPCDVDEVTLSFDDDDQDSFSSTRRSNAPCDVDEVSIVSDSSENRNNVESGPYRGNVIDDKKSLSRELLKGYEDDINYPLYGDIDSYEDPPPEAQTSYAREQLLRSSRFRELKEQARAQMTKNSTYYDELATDFLDEVEMSRGLGGYEEGFSVPTINSISGCHHLPLSIEEEDDELSRSSF